MHRRPLSSSSTAFLRTHADSSYLLSRMFCTAQSASTTTRSTTVTTTTRSHNTGYSSSAAMCNNNTSSATAANLVLIAAAQISQKMNQGLPPSSSSSSSPSSSTLAFAGDGTNEHNIRQEFKAAVEKRVIGNAALRKHIKNLHTSQYNLAIEAVEGCKSAGMTLDSDTCEVYLALLLNAGQLRQAMEVYHYMLSNKVCPNTRTFNQLMELCLTKRSWDSALTLFSEMQRRGRQPDVESYESALNALAQQCPPNWVKAVQVFDKLQRNKHALSSHTYNALMRVYLAMDPFDWRVVYNAYLEMRGQKPKIQFGWNSYDLVAEAMKRGGAGRIRRLTTFIDAWIQITPPLSLAMLKGMTTFIVVIFAVRITIFKIIWFVRDAMMDKQSESTDELIEH